MVLSFINCFICYSQYKDISRKKAYTISGFIEDSETGERLIGANIFNSDKNIGTVSNNYGYFSIATKSDTGSFNITYIGYNLATINLKLNKDTLVYIKIKPSIEIEEVIVSSKRSIVENPQMSSIQIPLKALKQLPVIAGEEDLLKTIQLMPGVQGGMEGTSGIYVRGGTPDQNLILLDGVPVYNVNHLFGVFSVFNTNAIKSATLMKGAFPARYGGRVSSVLDVRMKEGNMKELHGNASIGLISSKLLVEGPIKKDKTSFLISGRRTYFDILTYPFMKILLKGYFQYNFYDINAKINHILNDKNRFYLSIYSGNDNYYNKYSDEYDGVDNSTIKEKVKNGFGWGNITTVLRWNNIISKNLFTNLSITYSRYKFKTIEKSYSEEITDSGTNIRDFNSNYYTGINDFAGAFDFNYFPGNKHNIKFGGQSIYHTFYPGIDAWFYTDFDNLIDIDTSKSDRKVYSYEYSVYIEDEWDVFNKLSANVGIRYIGYYVDNNTYYSLEPRLSLRFLVNRNLSFKSAFSINNQYIHLLTNSSIGFPTDRWVPVTKNIEPVKSSQYIIGMAYNIKNKYELSIEGYYKNLINLIEYKEGAIVAEYWEDNVEQGIGHSYGIELLLKKNTGRTTGWISYTLSKADREFENINLGRTYPFKYDRRHDFKIVIMHKFRENLDAGLIWVYSSGYRYSLAYEEYENAIINFDDYLFAKNQYYPQIKHIDEKNKFKMPCYHRLDLGINMHKNKNNKRRTWSIGVYNAYCHFNTLYLDFYDDKLYKYGLLPIIPYLSYNIEF